MTPCVVACGGYSTTTRLVDGETINGNPVAPQAYALYLEATLEEAAGDLPTARETYLEATQFEGSNPELWTRVADISCRLKLASTDDEFDAALTEDRWYAPAWIARSRCELTRGNSQRAVEFARLAQVSAANDFETTDALATAYAQTGKPEAALRQWIAFTTLRPSDRRGWQRLADSSERLARPEWRAWAAVALGGAPAFPLRGRARSAGPELPAPFAEALLRDDLRTAQAYATDHSLSQVVVLNWALELGRISIALEQAKVLVAAYPSSADVRALALLAAARANDEAALDLWSRVPEELSALTEMGQRALQDLLRERCGAEDAELAGAPLRSGRPALP
jgi:tetratricopeptide (TPR) repeat protein